MTTDQELIDLRSRNEQRLRDAIAKMGTKHLLHPANRIKKLSLKKRKRK